MLPTHALALTRSAQAGDLAEVARLDAGLQGVWETFKVFGSLRVMYVLYGPLGFGDIAAAAAARGHLSARVEAAFAPLLAATEA